MLVKEVMTPEPICAETTASIWDVVQELTKHDVRHIPIVEDGMLVGMISDRDLRSYCLPISSQIEDPLQSHAAFEEKVTAIMHRTVVYVHQEAEVAELIDLMLTHKVGAIPVIDPNTRKVIGIVSYVDLLAVVKDKL